MELEKKHTVQDNFIGIFDNFFSEKLIQGYLDHFNYCEKNQLVVHRELPHLKKDLSINTMGTFERNVKYPSLEFIQTIYTHIFPLYIEKYPMLNNIEHSIFEIKIQKTEPTEGYHVWHTENTSKLHCSRIFAFSLYLNDIKEGGETEFLYQRCRVSPIKNRFILWPAGITHIHRGNPPLSNTKYILTGWMEYI